MARSVAVALELANHIAHERYDLAALAIDRLLETSDVRGDPAIYAELAGMLVDLRGQPNPVDTADRSSTVRRKPRYGGPRRSDSHE
jgi:hypothetical protein